MEISSESERVICEISDCISVSLAVVCVPNLHAFGPRADTRFWSGSSKGDKC